ncbi:MAG: DUF502 domain-containing protein [Candidatus Cyclobacteriaceae bacterium M2_1C_046]
MSKSTLNRLLRYFFRGLLFVVPLALTIYIIVEALDFVDSLIEGIEIPGLGLLIIIVNITFIGYLTSTFITKPFFDWLEKGVMKVPLANIIYTSIKDLIGAFVGDKKKFNIPVTVAFNNEQTIRKVGFITREDLEIIDMPGFISVYLPHSYNFSGNHFLVDKKLVKPLHLSSAAAMKFVVSGGVSGIEDEEEEIKIEKPSNQ